MAKNVLPKHWNGSEFEELHIVTKASNVFTNDNKSVQQKIDDFTSHLVDYVKHPAYAVATGSANAYSVTLNPAPTSYVEGMAVSVKINVDNTGPSTIDINGLGAKAIKKPNGNDVSAGNLKAGSIYTLRYNGTNFILQGEGGGGTAQPGDVLSGKTFTNDSGEQTGTMPNQGNMIFTPTTYDQTIPWGYHDGAGYVKGDPDLIPSNIRQGVNIFGVVGTLDVIIQPGWAIVAQNDTNKEFTSSSMTKMKAIRVSHSGTYRVSFTIEQNLCKAQIYVNDVPRGIERQSSSASPITFTEDITVNANDEISIYGAKLGIYGGTGLKYFRLSIFGGNHTNTLV